MVLIGLMSLLNRCLAKSALKGWLLIVLGMGILALPYLMMIGLATTYTYGYGQLTHQEKTYTVVYQREQFAFLYLNHVTLTEYLYPRWSFSPTGQRLNELTTYDGEENPGIPFVLPTAEKEQATYLNSFE